MSKVNLPAILFSFFVGFSTMTGAHAVEAKQDAAQAPVTQEVVKSTKINLNTADEATLAAGLNGIGQVKAKAIVEYRDAHGPFVSIDQLLEVSGIGMATLEKNRERLTID